MVGRTPTSAGAVSRVPFYGAFAAGIKEEGAMNRLLHSPPYASSTGL
jgi:hypothetical protein